MGFGHSFLRVFIWHVRFLLPIVLGFTAFLTISLKLFMFYITYLPEHIDFPSAASFPNFWKNIKQPKKHRLLLLCYVIPSQCGDASTAFGWFRKLRVCVLGTNILQKPLECSGQKCNLFPERTERAFFRCWWKICFIHLKVSRSEKMFFFQKATTSNTAGNCWVMKRRRRVAKDKDEGTEQSSSRIWC